MRCIGWIACLASGLAATVMAAAPLPVSDGAPPLLYENETLPARPVGQDPTRGRIHLGARRITLNETRLEDMAVELGAKVRKHGDASQALSWICADLGGGARLWLASDEIGGGRIDDLTLARVAGPADPACPKLRADYAEAALPNGLKLGMTEPALIAALGQPNWRGKGLLAFEHWRPVKGRPDWTYSATVRARVENGLVTALNLSRITTN